jgi:hypothetical protein
MALCKYTCLAGYADCDGQAPNGCEVSILTDVNNCGMCGTVCLTPNATPQCAAGACSGTCLPGYANCDNSWSNGCEINTQNDPNHCGSCTGPCLVPNGVPLCNNSQCAISQCNPGFKDCNNTYADGCEANLMTDPRNCGACNNVCSIANGTAACVNGQCAVGTCNVGFADCDGLVATGCEINIGGDPTHCGSCTYACMTPNASPACNNGVCVIGTCNTGFADCNHVASDGCEINTQTNTANCGACTHQCFVTNGVPACNMGMCVIGSCNTGFGDCDNNPNTGCETDLTTSSNCGTCGNNCAIACTGNVAATTCTNGSCAVLACTSGHFDIDLNCTDGCECTTSGDSANCSFPTSLGSLVPGQVPLVYSANLVPLNAEVYYAVTFTGNTNPAYHPHVLMTAGIAEFEFDIVSNCTGGLLTCMVEGTLSTAGTEWETYFPGSVPGDYTAIPPVGNNGLIIIHVYRRAGQPVSCNNFTLTITD